jgi:simple sugar transport system ATP-binding protein
VTKRYGGVVALEDVDFSIREGEIHCLVGENGSGKSTLVKVITGVVEPDHAEIMLGDEHFTHLSPIEALRRGVHVVHQDLSLFPNLTVAENIASHDYAESGLPLVRWNEIWELARDTLNRLELDLDPRETLGELRMADQQLVAICRCLAKSARLIIMDEPTASLTYEEAERLFGYLRGIQNQGVSILFISHRLDEILEIGQRITVLRNGRRVGTYDATELDRDQIIKLMTGKEVAWNRPKQHYRGGKPILQVDRLTRYGDYSDVSLSVHSGQVLGLIGPRGAGRTELALSIFGLNPPDEGTIYLEGRAVRIESNRHAMKLGIGYLPENRLEQGLVLGQTVENNVVITALDRILGKFGLTDAAKKRRQAEEAIEEFNVVAPSPAARTRTLSGGNQQKLVLAKWIRTHPKVLILDSPTNGVDVGAKDGIRQLIDRLAAEGVAILLISDEEAEILQNCPETMVMRRGRIFGPFETAELGETELRSKVREEEVTA